MARGGTSIGDLAYYGAIAGGGWIAFKLALDGELGCQAYSATAEIYRSLRSGQAPPAPRADTPAGKDPKCKGGLSGASAASPTTSAAATSRPAAAAPASPAAPTPAGPTQVWSKYQWHDPYPSGGCWLDVGWSDQHVDSRRVSVALCVLNAEAPITGDSSFQGTSLVDSGGFPVVWDASQNALRQDPGQGGTNVYGPGAFFVDTNGKQWTWIGPEAVLVAWDGSDQQPISSFFV